VLLYGWLWSCSQILEKYETFVRHKALFYLSSSDEEKDFLTQILAIIVIKLFFVVTDAPR
jgi:hypothetical protein